jgi:hypothetical protein
MVFTISASVDPDSPHSGADIRAALRALHEESVRYWSAMDTATFLAPLGEAWSPAENVRHLTKSVRAVTRGLHVPRLLLLLRFGRGRNGSSRTFVEMRETYRARLALGADAGAYGPGPRRPEPDADAERARIMSHHAQALAGLGAAIERWPEPALDRRRLPHPLLGLITVREMLFFTLYHNRHHLENVRRRYRAR